MKLKHKQYSKPSKIEESEITFYQYQLKKVKGIRMLYFFDCEYYANR